MMLPAKVEKATRLAAKWVKNLTDDWVVVKREILDELDNDTKGLFTRRDEKTKEVARLNEMELEVAALWEKLTGVKLVLRSFKERRDLRWWSPPEEG